MMLTSRSTSFFTQKMDVIDVRHLRWRASGRVFLKEHSVVFLLLGLENPLVFEFIQGFKSPLRLQYNVSMRRMLSVRNALVRELFLRYL